LKEGESPTLLDLRGREREPPEGGTAASGRGRPSSHSRREKERGHLFSEEGENKGGRVSEGTSCIYINNGLWRRAL